ncbi:MAG: hypothetical protein ACKOGH_12590 [Alphaproteobacteria bacterium]
MPDAVPKEATEAQPVPVVAPADEVGPARGRRGIDPRRVARLAIALALLAAVLGGIGGGAFASRHHLAVWMPSTRGVFMALGAGVKPSEISAGITGWKVAEGGAVHVGYRVANPTALSLPMPEICVEGRAEEGVTAFRRCFPPDVDKLGPDQARDAEFLVLDPAGAVREIELRKAPPPR